MLESAAPVLLPVGLLLLFSAILFALHAVRIRAFAGPFVMFLSFLWFLSFLTGGLDYVLSLRLSADFVLHVRYSSAIFTLIFVGILLVYVTEGVRESQNLIFVSLGAQLVLILSQVFFYYAATSLADEGLRELAARLFEPRYTRMGFGVATAAVDLFFAIACFQFLVNNLPRWPLGLLLFGALWATMLLDSAVFIAGTRLDRFASTFSSHFIYKTLIVAVLTGPLALYIRWFQGHGHLNLKRGSLDIFRRIEALEEDLAQANAELRNYADHLEEMVEQRTKEIKEKQRILDLELAMAADVQRTMLPEAPDAAGLQSFAIYRPCSAVSGDLYDLGVFEEGREAFFFIADISGHGVPAALVASMCKMSLSRIDLRKTRPAEILAGLSRTIQPVSGDQYLTAAIFLVALERRELVFASGAHASPLLLGPAGNVTVLPSTGPVIGTTFSGDFGQKKVRYGPGSRLVLYTDGLTEHRNSAGEQFGDERFQEELKASRSLSPRAAVERMEGLVTDFGENTPFRDDVTLMIADLP